MEVFEDLRHPVEAQLVGRCFDQVAEDTDSPRELSRALDEVQYDRVEDEALAEEKTRARPRVSP